MVYNPQTMKWEGNENVLNKFTDVDTANRKALLIKNKLQRDADDYTTKQKRYSDLQNSRPASRNQKVVGNMVLDEQNLRWVSISEEETDPFARYSRDKSTASENNYEETQLFSILTFAKPTEPITFLKR